MRATLEWMGCATFRLTVGDLVIFLDAYIDRIPSAASIGLKIEEISRADWIVIGHSHFDHLYGAERIAKSTGATLIGSHETIRIMENHGVSLKQLIPVAGGESVRLSNEVTVSVYPGLHSCLWSGGLTSGADEVCLGDLGMTYQERLEKLKGLMSRANSLNKEVRDHLLASNQGARGDGGPLVFLFKTPEGSLLFQDTCGYWTGVLSSLRPDVAILAAAGRGNIDGEPIQGSLAQFVAQQVDLLRPRRTVPCHHDDWLPGFTRAININPIKKEVARLVPETEVIELNYLEPYHLFKGL